MDYYFIKQDICVNGGPLKVIGKSAGPSIAWIKGRPITGIDQDKIYEFTASNDYREKNKPIFLGALVQDNYTLFHSKFKEALDLFGVDNIDYYQAKVYDNVEKKFFENYLLVNVLDLYPTSKLQSDKAYSNHIFRIDDKVLNPIVISNDLKNFLKEKKLLIGIDLINTKE